MKKNGNTEVIWSVLWSMVYFAILLGQKKWIIKFGYVYYGIEVKYKNKFCIVI